VAGLLFCAICMILVCARAPAAEEWNAEGEAGNAPAGGDAPAHECEQINIDGDNTHNLHGVHIIAGDDDFSHKANHASATATKADSVAVTSGVPMEEGAAAAHAHTGSLNQDNYSVNRGAEVRVMNPAGVLDSSGRTLSSDIDIRNVTTTATIVQFVAPVDPGRTAPEMSNLPNVVLQH
jgi:hypothetical protein